MFNALGLGFSFVLSFLILPEANGTLSEESNNDAFNDNVIILSVKIRPGENNFLFLIISNL